MLTTELDSVLILHILITGEEPKNKWHNNILVPRAFPVENGRGGKRKKEKGLETRLAQPAMCFVIN